MNASANRGLVVQLDKQLNLARIQYLDRAAVRGEPDPLGSIVGADAPALKS